MADDPIPALLPRGAGHQFLIYGDSCSGVPGAPHEATFAAVNAVVRRLSPAPDFILFPGDEVVGLTPDAAALRAQWRHWLDVEMGWLDRQRTPVWHTTGNHTAYDAMSEAVFRDVLALPRNGPPGQEGLSYWVRRGDLLLVFVHTLWTGLGGEGHVETDWLQTTLDAHADARHKIVLGHHPAFPINGFEGSCQREIAHEDRARFWGILVDAGVLAYVCSHILAFDVQVHRGVLQLCTAGAGTAHRMPEGVEYLHCVQAALDGEGLRYQVLDTDGVVREGLAWPPKTHDGAGWRVIAPGVRDAGFSGPVEGLTELRCTGRTAPQRLSRKSPQGDFRSPVPARTPTRPPIRDTVVGWPGGSAGRYRTFKTDSQAWAPAQTLFSAFRDGALAPLWVGLRGVRQTLTVIVGRQPGRSPLYWFGPDLAPGRDFDLHIGFHPAMGPGGILFRDHADPRWTSCNGASATGIEQLAWPDRWSIGQGQAGPADRPFAGPTLTVAIRTP